MSVITQIGNREALGKVVEPSTKETSVCRTVTDFRDFERLAGTWDATGGSALSPMTQFIWAQACAEVYCRPGELSLIVVEEAGRPVAIAPLSKRWRAIPSLELLGVEQLYEPMDFLFADAGALEKLVESLVKTGMAVRLKKIPADSPAIDVLRRAYRGRAWIHSRSVKACPYLELTAGWKEPERMFNAGRRSDLRRMQKKAALLGDVRCEVLAPAPDELAPLLDEAFQVELAGWKGGAGTALAVDPERGRFYRKYALAASRRGILRLSFLRINEEAAAMQMAVEDRERFSLLKIGHRDKYSACSPGNLLMLHAVKYAASRGLQFFEFLGTAEPWTNVWTEKLRPCLSMRIYPFNFRGAASLLHDAFTAAVAAMKGRSRGVV